MSIVHHSYSLITFIYACVVDRYVAFVRFSKLRGSDGHLLRIKGNSMGYRCRNVLVHVYAGYVRYVREPNEVKSDEDSLDIYNIPLKKGH